MSFSKLLTPKSLSDRFETNISSSKAMGVDGMSTDVFANNLDQEITIIQRKIENFSYRFSPFKEKLILKNKTSPPRGVYIPTVRDRLVLNCLNAYLNQQFQEDLKPFAKPVQKTISEVKRVIASEQFDGFLKLDVKNFFPSLDHEILLEKLQLRIEDKQALSLLRKVLNRSESGIAQGLSIASVLASIYLNALDNLYKNKSNLKYFRFVDDILILCKASDAKAIEHEMVQSMKALKLELHASKINGNSEKNEIGLLKQDRLSYLGYVFSPDRITVREASIERLRKRIRQQFKDLATQHSSDEIDDLYRRVNLKITGCVYNEKSYGWLFFFKHLDDLELLYHLDWFVKKTFKTFSVPYDPKKIKSFVRTYYKIKTLNPENLTPDTYIPCFKSSTTTGNPQKAVKKIAKAELPKAKKITELQAMLLELENDVEIYF